MSDGADPIQAGTDAATSHALASAKSGDISGQAVESAITVGASVAAGAACSALGAPELAPLCSSIAGKVIGPIVSAVGKFFVDAFSEAPSAEQLAEEEWIRFDGVVQEAMFANFNLLSTAQQKLSDAFAASGLPGTYDPWAVLQFLGVELVPTNKKHMTVNRTGGPGVEYGPWWALIRRRADGSMPISSDADYRAQMLIYPYHLRWMPPDFESRLPTISSKSLDEAKITADILAWRKSVLTAAMVGIAAIATAAASAEIARQIAVLQVAQAQAAATQATIDQAALVELAGKIAAAHHVLGTYSRGVTSGVTFLRVPKPVSAAQGFAALSR